jgi:cadmium resistance protein CadD (predicted permease)
VELLAAAALALATYVATNIDDVVVLTTQLVLNEEARHRGIRHGQRAALACVVFASLLIGNSLRVIPQEIFGLLGIVPIISALRMLSSLRNADLRRAGPVPPAATGFVTSFLVTIALSGDNFSIYIPLFRSLSATHSAITLLVFMLANAGMLWFCSALARHPIVVGRLRRASPYVLPFVLMGLGVFVMLRTGLI